MRLSFITASAFIAMGIALEGCATAPAPDPIAELNPQPEDNGLTPSFFTGPADLEAAIIQAQTLRRAGDLTGATRTLGQLVLIAPDDPRVLGEYGKTLVAKGDTEDAIAFLNRAIELQPGEWSLYSAQGVAFDQANNYAAANVAYSRALALRPGEPSVLSNAGLSRMQAGDLDGAEVLLTQALQQGGENSRITSNLALVQRLHAQRATEMAAAPGAPASVAEMPSQPNAGAPLPGARPAPAAQSAIESANIPPPANAQRPQNAQQQPAQQAGANPYGAYEALAADPTVMMAPIPSSDRSELGDGASLQAPAPQAVTPATPPENVPLPLRAPETDDIAAAQSNAMAEATAEIDGEADIATDADADAETEALTPAQRTADASEVGGLRRLSPGE